jgi:hypothetical protein
MLEISQIRKKNNVHVSKCEARKYGRIPPTLRENMLTPSSILQQCHVVGWLVNSALERILKEAESAYFWSDWRQFRKPVRNYPPDINKGSSGTHSRRDNHSTGRFGVFHYFYIWWCASNSAVWESGRGREVNGSVAEQIEGMLMIDLQHLVHLIGNIDQCLTIWR